MSEDIKVTDGTVLEALNNKVDLDGGNYIGSGLDAIIHEHCSGTGLQMFDTILKDHVLTYEESKGLALQGTYVYKDAIAGSRYGYPDFYNKCLEEYQNSTNEKAYLKSNVDIVGELTDNKGVLSRFSSSNYATLQSIIPTSTNIEIVLKVTPTSFSNTYNVLLSNSGNNYPFGFSSGGVLQLYNGSWVNGKTTYLANQTVWVRFVFNGSSYTLYSQLDNNYTEEALPNNWITEVTWSTTTNILSGYTLYLGYNRTQSAQYLNCSIDLNESYINIDGSRWWSGVDTFEYKKNSNGHLFYNTSQKDIVDEVFNQSGSAWFYGIDTNNERVFLPRNNTNFAFASNTADLNKAVKGTRKLVYSYQNGDDFCHWYSDGWLEQGGYSSSTGTRTITLYKPYLTDKYVINITHAYGSNRNINARVSSHTISSITAYCEDKVYWTTSGYGAIPTEADYNLTEQPEGLKQLLYICVGNTETVSTITDVVDITTTDNDTTPLFTGMYFDFTPNNASWLIAGGQANSGGIYTTCYNELVNVLNGETKYGDLKVIDTTNMISGVDYSEYWQVDQEAMTFTTPTAISLKAYENVAGVAGNGDRIGLNAGGTGLYEMYISQVASYAGGTVRINEYGEGQSYAPEGYSIGVTTDQTKSGIEAHLQENTTAQLYFKVANAVQNLELLDVGTVMEQAVLKSTMTDISPIVDGAWVASGTITVLSTTTIGTSTIDLSTYIPKDGYNYEILVGGSASGNKTMQVVCRVSYSTGVSVSLLQLCDANSSFARGNVILPLGTDRTLTVTLNGTAPSNCEIYIHAYRRLGTNA